MMQRRLFCAGVRASRPRIQFPLAKVGLNASLFPSFQRFSRGHATAVSSEAKDRLNLYRLVEAYRNHGHYKADIDPLGIPLRPQSGIDISNLASHGFSASDLDREFQLDPSILPLFGGSEGKTLKLREIIAACEDTYCGKYSVEYSHVEAPGQQAWLRERLETPKPYEFSKTEKERILEGLLYGAGFEKLLATKFPTEKRYGLDGVESLVPAIASIIDQSASHGVDHVVLPTCHRGRLALAGTVYGKPLEAIFAEFLGRPGWGLPPNATGDVKTHLGNEGERITANGDKVHMSLISNPSHLESVDPVGQGFAHAAQRLAGEKGQDSVLCLAMHGDAAFTGQGVVYETLSLSRLPAYDVGGTVRVIVNNQIGFTATPDCSRSTTYASDLAKFLGAPIFHANSDSVEDLVFVCQLAADWRATFKTDCVVDIVCYRRFGHNEMDQPRFTQPKMYETIAAHEHSQDIYSRQLLTEGSFTAEEIEAKKKAVWDDLSSKFEAAKTYDPEPLQAPKPWKTLPTASDLSVTTYPDHSTAIEADTLSQIVKETTSAPEGFALHSGVKRSLQTRKTTADGGSLDWTAGEAAAFGSLVLEGSHVRVLGEDAQRGTFSQRHAVFHDQKTGDTWTPLSNLPPDASNSGSFVIENSPLSEYGALGFEYGVTMTDPNALVVWEAQFGDFANTAQVIIDNWLSGAETKWADRSGLVLSLPHGFDGQGPEHSSARLERFLILSNEDGRRWPADLARQHQDCNFQIVYPTTPANYFHVLRRQIRRDFRKPLVVFFSKSLLRNPLTKSDISEFTGPSAFLPVITDPAHSKTAGNPASVERVILCTGQVYAALQRHREAAGISNVAITRIEELSPFPFAQVKENIDLYPNAKDIVWAQEEHYNGGAWHHVRDRLETVLRESEHHGGKEVVCVAREVSATTAAASKKVHLKEEQKLVNDAFTATT